MSYKLNKTDGTLLVDLVDGTLDTSTTDISLIGKNYSGFGEALNENMIKLLENFSRSSAPSRPLTGQIWFDTSEKRLKVYDGENFRTSGGPIVANQQPSNIVAGDLWINNDTNQLYFTRNGQDLTLAGPIWTTGQGKTGFESESVLDTQNNSKTLLKQFMAGVLVGVWSNSEFTPAPAYSITGLTTIKKGFNVIAEDYHYRGRATASEALINSQGQAKGASQFLPTDADGTTVGALTVANSSGVTIGLSQNNQLKVVGNSFVTENQLSNQDYKVRVRKTTGFVDAITIDTSESHVGIFKDTPNHTLHVGGDMRVDGTLFLTSPSVNIETQNLRVQDINIELGITEDSTVLSNAQVDLGGIILKSADGDKELLWRNATQAWTSSENLGVVATKGFYADGVEVLNKTEVGSTVTDALGLNRIGTLQYLNVDDININAGTITNSTGPVQFSSNGAITITNNQKITGLAEPTTNTDAATKFYVDDQINNEPVILSLDITGINNSQIATIIEDMYPAANKKNGSYAYVATTTLTGATVSGISFQDTNAANPGYINKSFVAVDANGVQNESVVQDFGIANAAGTVAVNIQRGLKRFVVSTNAWVFDTDLGSSGGLW